MITVYGIPNCDTCRKARRWLIETPAAEVAALGPDVLVNRRGTTWRQLPEEDRARLETSAADLLVAHPTLIKRPVIDLGDSRLVGFAAAQIEALAAAI